MSYTFRHLQNIGHVFICPKCNSISKQVRKYEKQSIVFNDECEIVYLCDDCLINEEDYQKERMS